MAVVTTGDTVVGTVPGLKDGLGGGAVLMYVTENPDGIVNPPQPTSALSGATVAFNYALGLFYQNTVGSTWVILGSVEA